MSNRDTAERHLRGSVLSSRDFLARMNELLRNVLMLPHLGDIQISTLPAPLRNFLLMIPDIDFGPRWGLSTAAEDDATEASVEESGDENSEATSSPTDTAADGEGEAVAQSGPLNRWGPLRPDAGALRRQNAIRRRRRCGIERARELHAELRAAQSAIVRAPGFPGPLPLFSHHKHFPTARSIELRMDRFLARARTGQLWADTQGEPLARTPLCKRPPRKPAPEKTRPALQEDSRNDTDDADPDKKMPPVSAGAARHSRKRPHECLFSALPDKFGGASAGYKRSYGHLPRKKRPRLDLSRAGDVIDVRRLGTVERARILRGLDCSYIRSGLAFALETGPAAGHQTARSNVDMVFSRVGGSLGGFFSAANLVLAVHFLTLLCGKCGRGLGKKCAVLNDVFAAALLGCDSSRCEAESAATKATLAKPLSVPFCGHVVDFHTQDLRFMARTDCARRTDLVRLQLQQWLYIRPFRHFGELFLLKYLEHAERSLRDPGSCASHRQQAVVFGRNLRELMFDISRGYEFVERARVPFVAERSARAPGATGRLRAGAYPPPARLPFAQEWGRRVCDRLVDYVTCADSCVLNVQLNYVLFTVRVDAMAAMEALLHRLLPLVRSDARRAALAARFARAKVPDRECVLVCALNRKTGRLEMQNTRAALDRFHAALRPARAVTPIFLWEPPLGWGAETEFGVNDGLGSGSESNLDSDDIVPDDASDGEDDVLLQHPLDYGSGSDDDCTILAGWCKREVRDGSGVV